MSSLTRSDVWARTSFTVIFAKSKHIATLIAIYHCEKHKFRRVVMRIISNDLHSYLLQGLPHSCPYSLHTLCDIPNAFCSPLTRAYTSYSHNNERKNCWLSELQILWISDWIKWNKKNYSRRTASHFHGVGWSKWLGHNSRSPQEGIPWNMRPIWKSVRTVELKKQACIQLHRIPILPPQFKMNKWYFWILLKNYLHSG